MVHRLGLVYEDQDKLRKAETMYLRALKATKKAWGIEHISSLNTIYNLGQLYAHQGKTDQDKMIIAEEMYQRALKEYKKTRGIEHTLPLNTINSLGNLYINQGKMAKAETMYVEALRGREKSLDLGHVMRLDMINELGVTYRNQGKIEKAREMFGRVIREFKETIAVKRTSTAIGYMSTNDHSRSALMTILDTTNNMGNLYVDQGEMRLAKEMYTLVLKEFGKIYAADHPRVLVVIYNLSLVENARK